MPTDVSVVGAGGHALVVMDALAQLGLTFDLWDEDARLTGERRLGCIVQHLNVAHPEALGDKVHIAIGHNTTRARLAAQCEKAGKSLFTISHPAASISTMSHIEPGVFIGANAVVAPLAKIGSAAIINHGAVVDHDAVVEAFAHVAPNATLSGGAHLGECSLAGAACVILPGRRVGNHATVAAAGVVTRDVRAGQTVGGIPARELEL